MYKLRNLVFYILMISTSSIFAQVEVKLNGLSSPYNPPKIDYNNQEPDWKAFAVVQVTNTSNITSFKDYTIRSTTTGKIIKPQNSSKEQRINFDLSADFEESNFFKDPANAKLEYKLFDNSGTEKAIINFTFKDISEKTGLPRPVTAALEGFIDENYSLSYNRRRNILTEGNTIHIFVDQDGNYIKSSLPTTAKEENTYQFHVLYWDEVDFKLSSNGLYKPATINIQNTSVANSVSGGSVELKEKKFGIIGPFTTKFDVEIKKAGESEPILKSTVPIAKLYHVSISTGLFKTTLKNPQNIEIVDRIENGALTGDSTLITDDPGMRGVITVMATYYPQGRSFLFPPSGGPFDLSRIGILVGAQLDDELSENFFLGISSDFARGGSFAAGIHCGRRNYVAGDQYDDFDFGTQQFIGELKVKKEWDVGVFFGVVIDTRVAGQLFKKLQDD